MTELPCTELAAPHLPASLEGAAASNALRPSPKKEAQLKDLAVRPAQSKAAEEERRADCKR
jgi:hypothetical protein